MYHFEFVWSCVLVFLSVSASGWTPVSVFVCVLCKWNVRKFDTNLDLFVRVYKCVYLYVCVYV